MKFRCVETKTPREGRATVRQVPGRARDADSRRGIWIAAFAAMTSVVRFGGRGAGRPSCRCDASGHLTAPTAVSSMRSRKRTANRPVVPAQAGTQCSVCLARRRQCRRCCVSANFGRGFWIAPVSWHGVTYRRNDGRGALRQTWSGLGRRAGATRQAIWPPRPSYLQPVRTCKRTAIQAVVPAQAGTQGGVCPVAQRAGRPAPRRAARRISPAASARLQLRARTRPDSGR